MQQKAKKETRKTDGYKFMNPSGVRLFSVADPGCLSQIPDTAVGSGIRDGNKSTTKIGGKNFFVLVYKNFFYWYRKRF
jgi:hypothetical protein